jgi:hypothetical protein
MYLSILFCPIPWSAAEMIFQKKEISITANFSHLTRETDCMRCTYCMKRFAPKRSGRLKRSIIDCVIISRHCSPTIHSLFSSSFLFFPHAFSFSPSSFLRFMKTNVEEHVDWFHSQSQHPPKRPPSEAPKTSFLLEIAQNTSSSDVTKVPTILLIPFNVSKEIDKEELEHLISFYFNGCSLFQTSDPSAE